MSFSRDVKEELSKLNNLANKDEVLCEFWGYFFSNNLNEESGFIRFSTENDYNIDRFAKIIRNIGIEDFDIDVNGKVFFIEVDKVYLRNIREFNFLNVTQEQVKPFIRGLFMGAGSINNPENKYHLECSLKNDDDARDVVSLMSNFDINLKQLGNTVYLKDGEEISKFLAFIGANKSVLKFEETRVQRHMNNKVNRIVNCETANLNKVLNASVEQINAIKKLQQTGNFEKLDESLKEIAILRLEYPDMPLQELGTKLASPVGKSGVNYRLKKLIKLAEQI